MSSWLTVVGIGEDGFAGLGCAARRALLDASTIIGGKRHLALLPQRLSERGQVWPQPFSIEPLLAEWRPRALWPDQSAEPQPDQPADLRPDQSVDPQPGQSADSAPGTRLRERRLCVLASGDPMLYGVGATLARRLRPDEYRVLPAPSSYSLAAARLGWPLQEVRTFSLVGRPLAALNRILYPAIRLLVLSGGANDPTTVARLLVERGLGASRMTILEHLGGPQERIVSLVARDGVPEPIAVLNLLAIDCVSDAGAIHLPTTAGLPDEAYRHDGQLTKRDVRAIVLARLGPLPGERLWDVGAGCGSIGIEWMRSDPTCEAIAIESDAGRRDLIDHNRSVLGVPALDIIAGEAPTALRGLPQPDAVFIGGGVTVPGVLDACWQALKPGGRLLANAVTLQSEAVLFDWYSRHGGSLTRIGVAHAAPLGSFDTWRQALPITLLELRK